MYYDLNFGIDDKLKENLAKILGHIYGDYDYGLAGIAAANGHFSDKGKLPWHPTFSTESVYSTKEYPGGVWAIKNGKETFTPSQAMVKSGATRGLAEYFRRIEPNSVLLAPVPYSTNVFK